MRGGRWTASVCLLGLASCTSPAPPPDEDVGAKDFTAAISGLAAGAPQSPELLIRRLDYADFLIGDEGDCGQRLTDAQSQLDAVSASPAAAVILPVGPARIANVAYRIHAERASCAGDPSSQAREYQAALEAAQRAVELYRDALDYQSMAIAQFNVAATYRALAQDAAAITALEAAIDMDREYGFRDDAEDNEKLLQHWTGDNAPVPDFPSRPAAFQFGWSAGAATVALDVDIATVVGDTVVHSKRRVTSNRNIGDLHRDWTVTYEGISSADEPVRWPENSEVQQHISALLLAGTLPPFPGIAVTHQGDFDGVVGSKAMAATLAASAPAAGPATGFPDFVIKDIQGTHSAASLEAQAAEDYYLGTATWIGAKLDQASWYSMSAQLTMPGTPFIAKYDIQFAYTRQVPCTATAQDRACAEIVVHATPDADDVKTAQRELAREYKLPDGQSVHYWSQTVLRLVTDPATLLPTVYDARRYWYIGVDGMAPVIQSQRTAATLLDR